MPVNPYDACPCGSGKKFKWCCTAYFDRIELALDQQQQGQHDAALRTMQELTAKHPTTPQVWGYYAHILFAEGKTEEAEQAIDRALQHDADFGMGHLLRGLFRQSEGEVIGALLLFRKAAEAYSPDAHDQLAQVNEMIARNELMLNRPVAARAALAKAVAAAPADEELRQQYEGLFGEPSRLPMAARKAYQLRPMTRPTPEGVAKLSTAKTAFEALTKQVPTDAAAWFNLGLVRAWLGEQPGALEATNKSVELETDDFRAEEAAALAEVLKCGQGMEAESDYIEHRAFLPVRDPQAVFGLLQAWDQERRMTGVQADPQGTYFSAWVVEELPSLLETGTKMATVVAKVQIAGGLIRVWHPQPEGVQKIAAEIRDRINLAVGEPTTASGPIQFGDIALEALAFPVQVGTIADAEAKMRDFATNYFEGEWLNRPRRTLGGASAVDAVGSSLMRKRVLGVLRLYEDSLAATVPQKKDGENVMPFDVYDFARLRHKLGIEMASVAAPPTAAAAVAPAAPKRDFAAMSAADLAGVAKAEMTAAELEDAMRAAIKLDARELAVAFAAAGVAKPADAAKPDRFPFYLGLITGALGNGDTAAAIAHIDAGIAYDAAHNGGKRGTDFGLRKAGIHAKAGNSAAAADAFDELIAANPDDGNLIVKAAEAMLSARNGAKAAYFAEKAVAKAQATGNRDLEGAGRELADAAKRFE